MNFSAIVSELVVALRQERSSAEVSRAMGYNYNKVHRWEIGTKQLRWDEFCDYCDVLEVPLAEVISRHFVFFWTDLRKFPNFLYTVKYSYHSVDSLAEKLHRHPSAIKRYLDGDVFPELEFILAFINLETLRIQRFILDLLPPDYKSPLRRKFEGYLQSADLVWNDPLAIVVREWLYASSYRELKEHDDKFIARRIGTSAKEVRSILRGMLQAGLVRRDENGKFSDTGLMLNQSGGWTKSLFEFYRFWYDRVAQKYAKGVESRREGNINGFKFLSVSREKSLKIHEVLSRAEAEIRGIAQGDCEQDDDVRVVFFGSLSTMDLS